jgi:hypothetical protein
VHPPETLAFPLRNDGVGGSSPSCGIRTQVFPCSCGNLRNLQTLSNPVPSKRRVQSGVNLPVVEVEAYALRGLESPEGNQSPQAVWVEYQRLYGPGVEAIFWSPAGTAAQQAKAVYAEWQALIERRITALREAGAGKGHDLTQRQAGALAGQWCRWFVNLNEENPGSAQPLAEVHEVWWNALIDTAGDSETGEIDMQAPEVRVELYPLLAREARTDQFLTDRGVVLSQQGKTAACPRCLESFWRPQRRSRRAGGIGGRTSVRPSSPQQPKLWAFIQKGVSNAKAEVRGTSALTATELFQAYVADKHPAPRTVSRWQGVFTALDAAGWQAPDWDAQGWLDGLKTEKQPDGTPVRKPITPGHLVGSTARRVHLGRAAVAGITRSPRPGPGDIHRSAEIVPVLGSGEPAGSQSCCLLYSVSACGCGAGHHRCRGICRFGKPSVLRLPTTFSTPR